MNGLGVQRTALADSLLPVLVGVLLVAFSPLVYHQFFAPRAAALLLVLGPGLVSLGWQAVHDSASRAAAVFLAVAAVATAVSPAPLRAVLGAPGAGTGLLFLAAGVSTWALARGLADRGRRRLRLAVLGGAVANVLIATMQHTGTMPIPVLQIVGDRPFGLTGNAVHLAALTAAAVTLVEVRDNGRRPHLPFAIALLGLLAFGGQIAGGRLAIVLLPLAGLSVALRATSTQRLAVAAALATGLILGAVLPGGSASASQRVAAGAAGGGFTARVETWRGAVQATAARPLLGYGPGRAGEALAPRRTAALARAEGPDRLFRDAHNVLFEHAVTTGVAGLAALGAWLLIVGRRARGPWAWCALLLGIAHLLEPMSVVTTPVMLAALGAAAPTPTTGRTRAYAVAGGLLALPGLVAAVVYLIGEVSLQTGSLDFSRASLERADGLIPKVWPTVPGVATRVEGFFGASDATARRRAVALAQEAVTRDPYDPGTWVRLGNLEAVWGSRDRARTAFDEALRRDPWSAGALVPAAALADSDGDGVAAAGYCRRLKLVVPARGTCAGRPLASW